MRTSSFSLATSSDGILIREALDIALAVADQISLIFGLATTAWLARERGDVRRAAVLWGAVERLDRDLGPTLWRTERDDMEAHVGAEVLSDSAGLADGRLLTTELAVEYALASID